MASAVTAQDIAASITLDESDYGSDPDEATIDNLLSQAAPQPASLPPNFEPPVILDDHGDSRPLARLARIRDNLSAAIVGLDSTCDSLTPKAPERKVSIEVEYDEGNRSAFSREYIRR